MAKWRGVFVEGRHILEYLKVWLNCLGNVKLRPGKRDTRQETSNCKETTFPASSDLTRPGFTEYYRRILRVKGLGGSDPVGGGRTSLRRSPIS